MSVLSKIGITLFIAAITGTLAAIAHAFFPADGDINLFLGWMGATISIRVTES